MAQGSFTEKVEIKNKKDKITIDLNAEIGSINVKRAPGIVGGVLGLDPEPVFSLGELAVSTSTSIIIGTLLASIPALRIKGLLDIGKKIDEPKISLDGFTGKFIMKDGDPLEDRVVLDADTGKFIMKGGNQLKNRVVLDADSGNICLGGNGAAGDFLVFPSKGDNLHTEQASIYLDGRAGDIWLGGNGTNGHIMLRNETGKYMIQLNGVTGDIHLFGADCAEDFNVLESEQIDAGTVLVIDNEDTLVQSRKAYDKRAIGVVSGAGDCKPGIILNKDRSKDNRVPVALTGKVYCKVDANYSPIEVGDLLTTSPTPGHAMKADDPLKSFGAVIGKALQQIKSGRSLIKILVALQ